MSTKDDKDKYREGNSPSDSPATLERCQNEGRAAGGDRDVSTGRHEQDRQLRAEPKETEGFSELAAMKQREGRVDGFVRECERGGGEKSEDEGGWECP